MMDLTHQLHQTGGGIRNGTRSFTMPLAQKKLGPIKSAGGKRFTRAVAVVLPIESKGIRRPCD